MTSVPERLDASTPYQEETTHDILGYKFRQKALALIILGNLLTKFVHSLTAASLFYLLVFLPISNTIYMLSCYTHTTN